MQPQIAEPCGCRGNAFDVTGTWTKQRGSWQNWCRAMGTYHMSRKGLVQSIPPAYAMVWGLMLAQARLRMLLPDNPWVRPEVFTMDGVCTDEMRISASRIRGAWAQWSTHHGIHLTQGPGAPSRG